MTTRTGGCHCGAIRYELGADPTFQVACHCRTCQYVNGGSPTLAMIVPRSALKITRGQPRTYWSKAESGAQVGRNFCEVCGTPIFSELTANPDIAAIKVGGLDDPSDFKVQADIWMKEAQPWHAPHDGALQAPGNPG